MYWIWSENYTFDDFSEMTLNSDFNMVREYVLNIDRMLQYNDIINRI